MYSLCEDKSGGLMLESQQHITSNIPQLSMISDARKGDNPLLWSAFYQVHPKY